MTKPMKGECDHCGLSLVETHYKEDHQFCPRCGNPISLGKHKEIIRTGRVMVIWIVALVLVVIIIYFLIRYV